jgi:POT family proton-dependent oligopeptide transporter
MAQTVIAQKFGSKQYFGHPAGLFVLFFTEMWERFSFYGMRALLVLYMTQYLLLDPARAHEVLGYAGLESILVGVFGELSVQAMSSQIYGLYTGFVYFTPFFGGMLADKVLGQNRTVYLGGILMAIGHFLMAIESFFLIALFFLILGNGCFKPNISTQVGSLYPEGDKRRDGAFTIFYMGINLGAFLAPLVCGTLGQKVGWHVGFGAAGVGMVLGLIVYWLGQGLIPRDHLTKSGQAGQPVNRKLTSAEWKSVWALAVLCVVNICFWAIYEQQGNTMQLWADDRTDWNILGWQMPSTWYQSMNPFLIFLFAPVLDIFWRWQSGRKKEPSSVVKMGLGCILCGLGFVVMVAAAKATPEGARGSVMWLLGSVWLYTMGELYLSPIGLSLVTKVAPAPIVSMMMGMWFLSSFFGNYLSGYIGTFYDKMSKDSFFAMLTVMGFGAGAVFFVLKGFLSKHLGKEV